MKKRRKHSAEFKAKVVLEGIKGEMTISQICEKYQIHSALVTRWKKELLTGSKKIFLEKNKNESYGDKQEINTLYKQIGKLKVENDFLREKLYP